MNVSVEEMKTDPARVIERVRDGETLILTDNEKPLAEIRPFGEHRKAPRPFGLAAGTFTVSEDFDAPLPDDVLRDFE